MNRTLQDIADELNHLEEAYQGAGPYLELMKRAFSTLERGALAECGRRQLSQAEHADWAGQAHAYRFCTEELDGYYEVTKSRLEQEHELLRARLEQEGRDAGGPGQQPGAKHNPAEDDEEHIVW